MKPYKIVESKPVIAIVTSQKREKFRCYTHVWQRWIFMKFTALRVICLMMLSVLTHYMKQNKGFQNY